MGGDKLWMTLGGEPVIARSLRLLQRHADIMVVAAPESRHGEIRTLCDSAICVTGGATRQESVYAALQHCADAEIVVVHDAARPLLNDTMVEAVVAAARTHGAATTAIPCVDTIKRVQGDRVVETLRRDELVAIQTPQAFGRETLQRAHELARSGGFTADDDAALIEHAGGTVHVVAGARENLKITTPADLRIAAALVEVR